jgi:hypothetical protein
MSSYIQFGSGKLYVNPIGGNLATNPTPMQALTIQDVTLDESGDIKELRGGLQWPEDTAVADKKGTGKFAIGRKDLALFNQIFTAGLVTPGGQSVVSDESHNLSGTSVVTTPPGTGTFATDLGVRDASSGLSFIKVASAPTAGQYSVATGTYTFAAADSGKTVLISYSYTLTTTGFTYAENNQVLGWGPVCEMYLIDTYQLVNGIPNCIHLYSAKVNKVTLGNKRADYSIPEIDFAYFANQAGKVMERFGNQ